jgi:hypothetical protein
VEREEERGTIEDVRGNLRDQFSQGSLSRFGSVQNAMIA